MLGVLIITGAFQTSEPSMPEQSSFDKAKAENDKLLLAQALRQGSKEWKRSKLSLLGQGRAGKTAFANAVAGRQFEETASTVGINQLTCDVKQMRVGDAGQAQWSEAVKADREYEAALAGMVAQSKLEPSAECAALEGKGDIRAYMQGVKDAAAYGVAAEQEEATPVGDLLMDGPVPLTSRSTGSSSPVKLRAEVKRARTPAPPEADVLRTPHHVRRTQKVTSEPITAEKQPKAAELDEEMVMKLLATMQDAGTGLLISLFDFGGQSVFEVIHHLFLTRNGVYALVFNMEWLLAEGPEKDRALRFMRNWLSSIAVHTYNKTTALTAPIVIVGTRLDKVASPADHEKISTLLHEQFSDNLAWQSVVGNEQGRDSNGRAFQWFFPVDNVAGRTGPTMQHLMSVVQREIDKAEYTHKEVPLTWFKAIDQMSDNKKDCLTLAEGIATARACGVSEQEASLMLAFLHDMGHLMWLDEPGLRDVVILDPVSYLVTPATIIICKLTPDHEDTIHHCMASHRECERKHKRAWSQLTHEGVLSVQLLPILWEKYQQHSEVLLQLLVKFGLLVPLHGDASGPVAQYLVPTLLTPASPEDAFIVNWTSAEYSTCYFAFTLSPDLGRFSTVTGAELRAAGFLPGGMFERIVGKALSWSQDTSVDAAIDLQSVILHKDVAVLAFGRQRFRLVNCADIHCVRVDVEGAHPIGVQQKLQDFIQRIIGECMKSLLCFCAVPFLSTTGDPPGSQSTLRKTLLPNELLIPLSQLRRASKGESMLVRKGQHTLLTEAEIAKKYCQWLQLHVLRDRYDVFLSYRWGRYDSEFTEQLFDMFTNFPLGEQNRAVEVFLDRRRLQEGRLFKSDFAKALTHSLIVVPVLSVDALARMVEHNPSQPDNVLLEWVMILESHTAGRVLKVFPILFGQRKTQDVGALGADGSAGAAELTVADFFAEKVQDMLPEIAPTATLAVAAELLRANGIEPSGKMPSYTVHSVVHAMLQFLLCKANDFPARRLVGDFAKKVVRLLHDCGSAALATVVTDAVLHGVAADAAQVVSASATPQPVLPITAGNTRTLVSLSVEELGRVVAAIEMVFLVSIFAEKAVTGTLLDCCDSVDDLMTEDIGVPSKLKAKALMKHIEGWRANGVSGL
jgi:GTPase SAR1 family protein